MDLKSREENYQHLSSSLDQLIKVYRTLLDVIRHEKEILISSDIESLTENNRSKEALLVKIKSLENQRVKYARDLASIVGTDIERPRLSDIAARFEGEQAAKLRNAQSVLELLVKRVAEINQENEQLVQAALRMLNGTMNSIKTGLQEKNTYEAHGKMTGTHGAAGNLVKREA